MELNRKSTRTVRPVELVRSPKICGSLLLLNPKSAASYRPISLLSVCFKVLERIILGRISADTEEVLSADQAGFRPGRSTCEQVLALSTFIENGFQQNLKTGAVFVDLTAAYDTVWQAGLLVKLVRSLPTWVVHTVEFLLKNRMFLVHIGDRVSRWRIQNNGLPQGSVLAPTLFNVYINDLPQTTSRKFIYADDICCATQADTQRARTHTDFAHVCLI